MDDQTQFIIDMESFKIDNDSKADWAVQKIKEEREEHDRLVDLINIRREELERQEHELNDRLENNTRFLRSALAAYMETVKAKETKTQKTYKLLSGSLVFKKASKKVEHDDEKLLSWLWNNDMDQYVENKPRVKWADLKKAIVLDEESGTAVNPETGEQIDGITFTDEPAKFDIK